ncbi:MAG: type II secretion system F family protein [Proteobacteria bacterium]|nr:type II secretion system F family protein [Pseudomonadota bacterium]MCH8212774.1 type II secretion system F family protein [Pseudomonadota bacterium]
MNFFDYLPAELSPENLIAVVASGVAFATVYAVWNALTARDPLGSRAKALRQHREKLKAGMTAARRSERRTVVAMGMMRRVIQRFNLMRTQQATKIVDRLAEAGWRSKDALVAFLFMKICLPFAFGAAAAFAIYGIGIIDVPPLFQLLLAMMCVVIGAYMPEVFVKNAIQKRRKVIQKGLPDTLDLLVICAEAGLALDAALTRVSREMERSCPEVADEFSLTAVELGFLPDRKQALKNLIKRVRLPSIRGVVNTLMQTEKYGTPLSQALRVLATEYRNERMLKAEEKATKLPALLTVPLIVFIMPTLFIVLLGPAILRAIDGLSNF